MLDSDNHWQVVRHVGLPLAWPVVTVAITVRLIEGFKAFGLPYALTGGGPGTSTQLYSAYNMMTTVQFFNFGDGSAMGLGSTSLLAATTSILETQDSPGKVTPFASAFQLSPGQRTSPASMAASQRMAHRCM